MEQLRVILDRLTRMVAAEGGKPSDIVKLTTFVKNTDDWFPFDGEQAEIYHEFFGDDYPTNTIVGARFPVKTSTSRSMPWQSSTESLESELRSP